ncbi:MAG: hypothetical protein JXA03_13495 [Bacteroidales bacterium]|nr:hypothetical protein [Bacteroidales bacterium]
MENCSSFLSLCLIVILVVFAEMPCHCQNEKAVNDLVYYGFGRFDTLIKKDVALPAVFDLRGTGRLGRVKKQPARGCWSAASISSLESTVLSSGYGDFVLSEKNLYSFHGFDSTRTGNGNHYMATAYFTRGSGPVIRGGIWDTLYNARPEIPFLVTEAMYLPSDPEVIKQSVMHCGAVYSMMNYTVSFFDDSTYMYCLPMSKKINHVVNITGWNDTLTAPGGRGAWIVQNSRGEEYADSGFFYICYRDVNILEYNALWTEWMDFDRKMEILCYDTCGSFESYGFRDSVACGLVRFSSETDMDLTMLGFYVNHPNTSVIAKVYTRFDTATRTLEGEVYSSERHTFRYPGYYNIKLNGKLRMKGRKDFFVEMRFVSPGQEKPVPVEVFIRDYCDPHITASTCWVNPDSEKWPEAWYECGRNSPWPYLNFDICIRVYGFPVEE